MARKKLRIWCTVVLVMLLFVANLQPLIHAKSQVPCFFIFGDSLVDNGNNNHFEFSKAKANYPPYGIDFPDGPTGRFTNGRTLADIITQLLGFDNFIPPFVNTTGRDILKGVNYASGAGGILQEAGRILGERYSMNMQLQNHETTILGITELLGSSEAAEEYLAKCIYYVGMGSNDYFSVYLFLTPYAKSPLYNPYLYAIYLIQHYSQQLRTLYKYGARKVAVIGLLPVGCCLPIKSIYGTNNSTSCVDKINSDINIFNAQLKSLVDELNNDLPNANFTYINAGGITLTAVMKSGNTLKYDSCCNINTTRGPALCPPNSVPCSNRSMHVLWDSVHPSETVNVITGKRAYNAETPLDAYPFDIAHLAQL